MKALLSIAQSCLILNIPASVETIGANPFMYCAISHYNLEDDNKYFKIEEEALIEKETGRLISFPKGDGKDSEPTYNNITEGAWLDSSPYGVVHRIATDGSERGIGSFCISWAFEQCGHLRIGTHGDNTVMQHLVKKLGFVHCGTIYVEEDNYPRLAFEKIRDPMAFHK